MLLRMSGLIGERVMSEQRTEDRCDDLRIMLRESTKNSAVIICSDYDDECQDIECHVTCWLYDPVKGMCPFLRAK